MIQQRSRIFFGIITAFELVLSSANSQAQHPTAETETVLQTKEKMAKAANSCAGQGACHSSVIRMVWKFHHALRYGDSIGAAAHAACQTSAGETVHPARSDAPLPRGGCDVGRRW